MQQESGPSLLSEAEYWNNHCDRDVLKELASAKNLADWANLREEQCAHGEAFARGETDVACRAGFYLHTGRDRCGNKVSRQLPCGLVSSTCVERRSRKSALVQL